MLNHETHPDDIAEYRADLTTYPPMKLMSNDIELRLLKALVATPAIELAEFAIPEVTAVYRRVDLADVAAVCGRSYRTRPSEYCDLTDVLVPLWPLVPQQSVLIRRTVDDFPNHDVAGYMPLTHALLADLLDGDSVRVAPVMDTLRRAAQPSMRVLAALNALNGQTSKLVRRVELFDLYRNGFVLLVSTGFGSQEVYVPPVFVEQPVVVADDPRTTWTLRVACPCNPEQVLGLRGRIRPFMDTEIEDMPRNRTQFANTTLTFTPGVVYAAHAMYSAYGEGIDVNAVNAEIAYREKYLASDQA